jgi:hypothetical protein
MPTRRVARERRGRGLDWPDVALRCPWPALRPRPGPDPAAGTRRVHAQRGPVRKPGRRGQRRHGRGGDERHRRRGHDGDGGHDRRRGHDGRRGHHRYLRRGRGRDDRRRRRHGHRGRRRRGRRGLGRGGDDRRRRCGRAVDEGHAGRSRHRGRRDRAPPAALRTAARVDDAAQRRPQGPSPRPVRLHADRNVHGLEHVEVHVLRLRAGAVQARPRGGDHDLQRRPQVPPRPDRDGLQVRW